MELRDYLSKFVETCPQWLHDFRPQDKFDRTNFFKSRVVYYPGSGTDGHAVKLFGSSHSAHCFMYVDYLMSQSQIEEELAHTSPKYDRRFNGYHSLARCPVSMQELVPEGWTQHINAINTLCTPVYPYAFLEVLERNENLDASHGAKRLAILFLGADGIASYDALFCQKSGTAAPFVVLVTDNGFGGNYDSFGGGGLLEELASTFKIYPEFLMVADNSIPWKGYSKLTSLDGEEGGMHSHTRYLFVRDEITAGR